MQTVAWSLMNSLGLFPAGRADAERRNRTCFSILLHFFSLLLILYSIRDTGRGRVVGGVLRR